MSPFDAAPRDEALQAKQLRDLQAGSPSTASSAPAVPLIFGAPPAAAGAKVSPAPELGNLAPPAALLDGPGSEPFVLALKNPDEHKSMGLMPGTAETQAQDAGKALAPINPAVVAQGAAEPALLRALFGHKLADGLQVPSPQAQARAKPFLERWIIAAQVLGAQEAPDAPQDEAGRAAENSPPLPQPAEPDVSSPRSLQQYPITQSLRPDAGYGRFAAHVEKAPELTTPAAGEPARARPPAGTASIRPAAQRRKQPAKLVPQKLLQSTSEAAVMWSGPSGETSFRIDFSGDIFDNTACVITVLGHDVRATFYVDDVNARRLLEAEQRRLQDSLEARGLSRAQVRIVTGAPPEPFAPLPSEDDDPEP